MSYFPFYYNIDKKRWLIVGGGRVAYGKLSRLMNFTGCITVIAPDISEKIKRTAEKNVTGAVCGKSDVPDNQSPCEIRLLERRLEFSDLDTADFVIAASDDRELNRNIAIECRKRRIPVNSVDDPENCDFIFPAVIKKGDLTVSISTGGASPAYASMLKKKINDMLPENIGIILEKMSKARKIVPEKYPDLTQHERSSIYKKLLDVLLEREISRASSSCTGGDLITPGRYISRTIHSQGTENDIAARDRQSGCCKTRTCGNNAVTSCAETGGTGSSADENGKSRTSDTSCAKTGGTGSSAGTNAGVAGVQDISDSDGKDLKTYMIVKDLIKSL